MGFTIYVKYLGKGAIQMRHLHYVTGLDIPIGPMARRLKKNVCGPLGGALHLPDGATEIVSVILTSLDSKVEPAALGSTVYLCTYEWN